MRKRKKECDMRQIKEACFPVFRSSLWRVGSIRSERGLDPSQSSVARSWYYKSFFLSRSVYVASSSSFPCISFDAIWLSHAMFAQRDEKQGGHEDFSKRLPRGYWAFEENQSKALDERLGRRKRGEGRVIIRLCFSPRSNRLKSPAEK